MKPIITSRTDWSEGLIHEIYPYIEEIAFNDLGLTNIYANQIAIISAEHMIDAYASSGMPVNYSHWSFGKRFLSNWTKYNKGNIGLAYEIVINSDPCISYLMEENNAITQTLVMAHACFGHNFVFKNNYMFLEWTQPASIIDYMLFAKNYIRECEEKYGEDEVEMVLDAAHSLAPHAVDTRRRKHKKKLSEEDKQKEAAHKENEKHKHLDIILKKTTINNTDKNEEEYDLDKINDEENILYFIYKNSPNLDSWKREILRIVHKIQQYFYGQSNDQVLNEGFATFTHFYIINELEKKGIISSDAMLAALHLHSSVIFQPDLQSPSNHRYLAGSFNPYALGLDIYKEIRRTCENPTKEDEEWSPHLVGQDWRKEIKKAASDYRDDSFIQQFLTPTLMRKYKMMLIKARKNKGNVVEIADDLGYRRMRDILASQHQRIETIPDIVVTNARMRSDRMLTLEYRSYLGRPLYKQNAERTLKYVKYLWGYDVEIVERDCDNKNITQVKFSTL